MEVADLTSSHSDLIQVMLRHGMVGDPSDFPNSSDLDRKSVCVAEMS